MTRDKTKAATRRQFIGSAAAVAATSLLARGSVAQGVLSNAPLSSGAKLADDAMRPRFHLLPASNWMNDPNGPIFFNGSYHMFFQYNPHGATWGDMSWNHAISPDMLHWTHLPLALTPTPDSPDSFGVFSGSAIQVGRRVYVVYTGTRQSTPQLATIRDGTDKIQESQCFAWSDDPKLITWTKDPQPIVPLPPPGLSITGFRDPSAWKQGDMFYMTVGSGIAKRGGCVLLYRSHDLKTWEYLHELTSGNWNGKPTANPCDDGEMWECPEFFPLDGRHVLIYSTLGKVFWQSGVFDEVSLTFKAQQTGLLDLDAFYAPKTQLDADGRRILWGWIPERRSEAAMRQAGWSGMMSLPRVMNLDKDGTLKLAILPQASVLRGERIRSSQGQAQDQSLMLPSASGELQCIASVGTAFQLSMRAGADELISVSYLPQRSMLVADGKEVQLQAGDAPTLHAFVDGSVIELILGGRVGYTKRFYYPQSTAPDIEVRVAGAKVKLEAWTIEPISSNRLTTPAHA